MRENDSSVKGGAPAQKPTKYRLACDSCQHSKIRCDQERPKCRRCAKKGIECVYSPARRAGRPRTRNNSKGSSCAGTSTTTTQKGYLTPMTEKDMTIPVADQMSPFAPTGFLSVLENYSSSSSSSSSSSDSNTSTISSMATTVQIPSPENMDFSPYQQPDDDFLQGLPDFAGSQSPQQTSNCYCPMSPEFQIAPELLHMGFLGTPWEQQHEYGQCHSNPSTMLLDESLPYFGLLDSDGNQPYYHPDQRQEDTPIPMTSSKSIDGCNVVTPLQQQVHPQFPQPLEPSSPSTKSCNCVSILLDHLSAAPSCSPSSSPFASTSAALSTSRALITCCSNTMACSNGCSTRPSTALVICEAIDRALVSLKLGGASLWTPVLASNAICESGASSPPSTLSSSDTSSGIPVVDDEHEPLRCGTLPIRGADRRAVVRVLLVKRVMESQRVLERLRDTLLSGLLVGEDATVKNPLLALCADVAGEFATKVADRVETVKLQM